MTRERPAIAISYGGVRRLEHLPVLLAVILACAISDRQNLVSLPSWLGGGLASRIDHNAYQAVFLTGGQVFFGKADTVTDEYIALSDVFYLSSGSDQQANQLIKRGTEVQGPSEPMLIPMRSVLFVENLRADSDVVSAITKFHAGTLPITTPQPGSLAPAATPTHPVAPAPPSASP